MWERGNLYAGTVICAVLLGMSGCGSKGNPDRVIVKGKISYQGSPLDNGQIRLVPTGDTRGQANVAFIEQGRFEFVARDGVQIGTHRVEVLSYRPIPGAKPYTAEQVDGHPDLKVGDIPKEQYIPSQFNKTSQLEVKVEQNGGSEMNKDFDLK